MEFEEFLELDLKEYFKKNRSKRADGKRACIEIQHIFKNFKIGGLGKLLEESCEKCGEQTVYCGHVDLGGYDNYDNSWHLCLSCLDARHSEVYTSMSDTSGWFPSYCPWCERKYSEGHY